MLDTYCFGTVGDQCDVCRSVYTTKRSQFPTPHQQSAYTNLTLCRGLVLGNMICSLSNSKEDGGVQRADARSLGVWFGEIKGCVSVIYVYWEVIPLGSHYIHGVSSNTSDHDGIFLHVVVELA